MADIIEEIKEDIKQEKNLKLWKKYGTIAVSICLAIIIGTSLRVWIGNKKLSQNQSEGNKLFSSLQKNSQGKPEEAIKSFNDLQDTSSAPIAAIASLQKAHVFEQEASYEQAMQAYLELSKTNQAPIELKNLAELKYLNLAINLDKIGQISDFDSKLKRLSEDKGIWQYSAIELSAHYRLKNNENKEAIKLFTQLKDDQATPPAIRENAANMLTILN